MLKFFRQKHIAKIIFWGLAILILPAFVLWGTGSMPGSKTRSPTFAGIIDKKKVSFADLYESIAAIRAQIILNYFNQPKVLAAFLKNKTLLAKLAWDRLIMAEEAKRRRIKIPDGEVIALIRSHPIFARNGAFDERLYEYILRNNLAISARNFEEVMRENLAIKKLNDIVTKDIKASEEETLSQYRRENEKFKIAYALIETKEFLDKVNIEDTAIKDYYEAHKTEFALTAKEADKDEERFAKVDDVKSSIRAYLAEREAKSLSLESAMELHKKILEIAEKEGGTFEAACAKLDVKIFESGLLSMSDYLEGVGEASPLIDAALKLKKPDRISEPIETRGGVIIFKVLEKTEIDEKKFKMEKAEYSKKALGAKKMKAVDAWFRDLFLKTQLKIDFENIDKYYR